MVFGNRIQRETVAPLATLSILLVRIIVFIILLSIQKDWPGVVTAILKKQQGDGLCVANMGPKKAGSGPGQG